MKYELNELSNNNYNDLDKLKYNLLKTRGVKNVNDYINIIDKPQYENSYNLLDNIDVAAQCLLKHIENGSKIFTIGDCDCDGICSMTELIHYLKSSFNDINIEYAIHSGKQHGLSYDIKVPEDTNLIIITDASSNDYEQHKYYKDKGMDIIVLDHHEAEKISENAIVVNNQLCNYPNKQLCGSAIVYKFLQKLDEELWQLKADDYLDLVALGLIGDSMNINEMETKYYIEKGLAKVRNKQFKALLKKQEYSTKGLVNINNIAFYIVPLINAMIRIGKQDEKLLLYKGFLEEYEEFDYKPRGNKPMVKEDIYTRVARLCSNTKSRQDKMRDKAFTELTELIETKNKLKDKVLILNCHQKYNLGLTGVIAIKVADKYNRPCVLLNKSSDDENLYRGSGRNTDRNNVTNLKKLLNDTKLFEAEGHPQAMGVKINKDNIKQGIEKLNDQLKDVSFDSSNYQVDFIIPFEDLEDEIVYEIDLLKGLWGKGLEEPKVAITNIEFSSNDVQVLGKTNNTLKIVVDGVEFIKFRIDSNDKLIQQTSDWEDDSIKNFTLDIVGRCSSNVWDNKKSPQIIIEDYNITKIN